MILEEHRRLREQFAEYADMEWSYFFGLFGRFEYAMKEVGWLVEHPKLVAADWNRLAQRLPAEFWAQFQDCQETNVLFAEPARRRRREDGQALWPAAHPEPPFNNASLFQGLKNVRNNLFHGDKQVGKERDQALVAAGVAVLEEAWEVMKNDHDFAEFRSTFCGMPRNE